MPRNSHNAVAIAACLVGLLGVRVCVADAAQSLESIQAAAEQAIREHAPPNAGKVFAIAEKLDARLRLKQCGSALTTFLPSGANLGPRATVGVRCTVGAEWTVYVPVRIETEARVLVLQRALDRNSAVTAQDVEMQIRRVPGLSSSYIAEFEQLKRQHLKRPLPAGSVLSPDVLTADVLVKRGQQVMLLATVGGIEVRANGVALTDGIAAGRIKVQNLNSLKVVEGTVDTDSVVRVPL